MNSAHKDALVDFQSVTGILDSSLATNILEGFEWDVNAAVNSLIDTSDTVERTCQISPVDIITSTAGGSISSSVSQASNNCDLEMLEKEHSDENINILEFTMRMDTTSDPAAPRTVVEEICLQDTASIHDLKEIFFKRRSSDILLLATSFSDTENLDLTEELLVSSLRLEGILGHSNPDNSTILKNLHLPRYISLSVHLELPNERQEEGNSVRISLHVPQTPSTCSSNGNLALNKVLLIPLDASLAQLRLKVKLATGIELNSQIWKLPVSPEITRSPANLQELVNDLNLSGDPSSVKSSRTLEQYQLLPDRSYSFMLDSAAQKDDIFTPQPSCSRLPKRTIHIATDPLHSFGSSISSRSNTSSSKNLSSLKSSREESRKNNHPFRKNKHASELIIMDDPENVEYIDFDDDDDVEIVDEEKTIKNEPMILHEQINLPCQAIEHFTAVFLQRYCQDGAGYAPSFIPSSLEDALNKAFRTTRINDRKPFFIYLHNDKSIAAHVFCQQLLCSVEINQFLSANDIAIWPWDVTRESAKENLMSWLEPSLHWLANVVRQTSTDRFPLLIMLGKVAGSLQVIYILTGIGSTIPTASESPWPTEDEMMSSFPSLGASFSLSTDKKVSTSSPSLRGTLKAEDVSNELWQKFFLYKEMLVPEIDAEKKRMEREVVRLEQDEAYQASLRHDQLKIKAKKEEEEDSKRRELLLQVQQERQKIGAIQHCILSANALPKEAPEPGSPEAQEFLKTSDGRCGIATIRFRLPPGISLPPSYEYLPEDGRPPLPSNGMVIRRFRGIDRLYDLKNFMEFLGFSVQDFKLLTTYPRVDLTSLPNDSTTMEELKLVPQETLIFEQR